jgi:hypothetical protein
MAIDLKRFIGARSGSGTVGWARTTDLLFHRQATYHPIRFHSISYPLIHSNFSGRPSVIDSR